jgi:hypothetical protein
MANQKKMWSRGPRVNGIKGGKDDYLVASCLEDLRSDLLVVQNMLSHIVKFPLNLGENSQ